MLTYRITVDELNSREAARILTDALNDAGADYVKADYRKGWLEIDTSLSVEEIYDVIEEAGFSPADLDII